MSKGNLSFTPHLVDGAHRAEDVKYLVRMEKDVTFSREESLWESESIKNGTDRPGQELHLMIS